MPTLTLGRYPDCNHHSSYSLRCQTIGCRLALTHLFLPLTTSRYCGESWQVNDIEHFLLLLFFLFQIFCFFPLEDARLVMSFDGFLLSLCLFLVYSRAARIFSFASASKLVFNEERKQKLTHILHTLFVVLPVEFSVFFFFIFCSILLVKWYMKSLDCKLSHFLFSFQLFE